MTLNYDRSLEQFLLGAFTSGFGWSEERAFDALDAMHIVHVHGSLGALRPGTVDHRPYSPDTGCVNVLKAARAIITLHDGELTTPAFTKARELLAAATNRVCLGFSYDKITMERLGFRDLPPNSIHGTAFDMGSMEVDRAKSDSSGRLIPADTRLDTLDYLRSGQVFFT